MDAEKQYLPPQVRTIAQMFWHFAAQRTDDVMMRQKEKGVWRAYTWRGVRQAVDEIGNGLLALGLSPSDVVSVLANTCKEWVWADLAGLSAGAIVSGVYPTDAAAQLEYLCADSHSVVLFVEDEEQLDKYLQVRERLPALRRVVVFDMKGLEDFSDHLVLSLEQLRALGREYGKAHPQALPQRLSCREYEDLAALVYTSGTTGKPKGAMLSNRNLLAAIEGLQQHVPPTSRRERISFLPLCHVSERIIGAYFSMLAGARMNFVENPETVFDNVREVQPDFFAAVPRIWEKFYSRVTTAVNEAAPIQQRAFRWALGIGMQVARYREQWKTPPLGLQLLYGIARLLVLNNVRRTIGMNRVEVAITGAAPISPELLRWFMALGIELNELWGMSELAGAAICNPCGRARFGSIGVPLSGVRARISAAGELEVAGPQVFMGYLNQSEKSAETMDGEWLRTGDVGRCDEDGYFYITDRMKDIIITAGGKNITPSEWENQLKFSPYVTDAVVIGDRRAYLSCLVMIDQDNVEQWAQQRSIPFSDFRSLARHPDVLNLIGEEVEKVNRHFARVEQIKDFRLIETRLTAEDEEMTPTMKLKRTLVNEKYAGLIDSMYPSKAA